MTAHPEKKEGMRKDKGERRGVCGRKRQGEGEARWFLGDPAFHRHVTGECPAGPHRALSSVSLPSILTALNLLYLKTEAEGRERRVPRKKGHRWVFRCLD